MDVKYLFLTTRGQQCTNKRRSFLANKREQNFWKSRRLDTGVPCDVTWEVLLQNRQKINK